MCFCLDFIFSNLMTQSYKKATAKVFHIINNFNNLLGNFSADFVTLNIHRQFWLLMYKYITIFVYIISFVRPDNAIRVCRSVFPCIMISHNSDLFG